MQINSKCVGCRQCWPYCPVGAIGLAADGWHSTVDPDRCVECGTCLRSRVCPTGAFEMQPLAWPRNLRSTFSDVLSPHKATGVLGRGTEEMKTNDVTGRLRAGWVNVAVELGRPGVGASFADVQTVTRAVAAFGVEFEKENPVTAMMADTATGQLPAEVLGERVLSALVEFEIETGRVPALVDLLQGVGREVDTVFSVAVAEPLRPGGQLAEVQRVLAQEGIWHRPNGKTNVGLGRPLFKEDRS